LDEHLCTVFAAKFSSITKKKNNHKENFFYYFIFFSKARILITWLSEKIYKYYNCNYASSYYLSIMHIYPSHLIDSRLICIYKEVTKYSTFLGCFRLDSHRLIHRTIYHYLPKNFFLIIFYVLVIVISKPHTSKKVQLPGLWDWCIDLTSGLYSLCFWCIIYKICYNKWTDLWFNINS
jgi:hypothetical protein